MSILDGKSCYKKCFLIKIAPTKCKNSRLWQSYISIIFFVARKTPYSLRIQTSSFSKYTSTSVLFEIILSVDILAAQLTDYWFTDVIASPVTLVVSSLRVCAWGFNGSGYWLLYRSKLIRSKSHSIITSYLITRWLIFGSQYRCNPPWHGYRFLVRDKARLYRLLEQWLYKSTLIYTTVFVLFETWTVIPWQFECSLSDWDLLSYLTRTLTGIHN